MCTWAGCTCGDPAQNTTGSRAFGKIEMMYVAGPLLGAFGLLLFSACVWRWRRQMGEIAKEVTPQFVLDKFAIKDESETSSSSSSDPEDEMGNKKRKQQKQDELKKRAKMRDEANERSKRGEYHLTLCIYECMYLPRLDQPFQDTNLVGLSDPYVKIILVDDHMRQEAQTEVKKATLFPKFEQTFGFYFTASDKTKEKKENLTIQVWDWDLGKKNDFSGETVLRLQTLMAQYHARNNKSKPLEIQATDHLLWLDGTPVYGGDVMERNVKKMDKASRKHATITYNLEIQKVVDLGDISDQVFRAHKLLKQQKRAARRARTVQTHTHTHTHSHTHTNCSSYKSVGPKSRCVGLSVRLSVCPTHTHTHTHTHLHTG